MGNAHAWRHRNGKGLPCAAGCIYCKNRPKDGLYSNKNGHRRNTRRKKKQKRGGLKLG